MDNYSPQLCAVRVLVIKALRMIQIVPEKLLATQEEMLMSLKLLVQKLLENSNSPVSSGPLNIEVHVRPVSVEYYQYSYQNHKLGNRARRVSW